MNANDKIAEPKLGTSQLVRPRYSPGLLLQDEDLTRAVDYTRELSRLLFRSLFGCGVVCGLVVRADEKCGKLQVTVAPGVALDGFGDPVQIREPQSFVIDPTCGKPPPPSMCVVLRHHEKCCQPRTAACGADDEDAAVCTRIAEGFELRLLGDCPKCACGCAREAPKEEPVPAAAAEAAKVEGKPLKAKDAKASAGAEVQVYEAKSAVRGAQDCACANPADPCYQDHYCGKCACCDSEWVVLAVVKAPKEGEKAGWRVDHSVRRFVRPVLMRDPQVELDRDPDSRCKDA